MHTDKPFECKKSRAEGMQILKRSFFLAVILLASTLASAPANSGEQEKQVVLGAGPSTEIARIFFEHLVKKPASHGYEFEVPPYSSKHAGGIKATEHMLFGRTGRPLDEQEKNLGKEEIPLARVQIVFVVHKSLGVGRLNLDQLRALYLGSTGNWKELGGPDAPVIVLGRERDEALYSVLKQVQPFFAEAKFSMVLQRDHEMVIAFKKPIGRYAIGFGALPNFRDQEDTAVLSIDGLDAGMQVGLVYDRKNAEHPLVRAAKDFAASAEWAGIIEERGYQARITTAGPEQR